MSYDNMRALFINTINLRMKNSQNLQTYRKTIANYSYQTHDVIGKGYSSVVYRGVNDSNGQTIALKLIDMKNMKGDVHKILLSNQIEILKLLSNQQNIIKLYEIISLKATTCIITELCGGGDLAKIIKNRRFIPERQATDILLDIINGYRGINKYGILHRDLKPANVFFSQGTVKIADFGFAVRNAEVKKANSYNVGSPVYMPLQALNDNNYSYKSDIWAIGIIFYEMLTGHTPWRAKTQADLKKQIKAVPIKSLIPVNVSKRASQFLIKSLQINPILRMSTQQLFTFFDTRENAINQHINTTNTNTLRTNYLFRPKAMSQDRDQNMGQTNFISKNTVTAPKNIRNTTRLGNYMGSNDKICENVMNPEKTGQNNFVLQKIMDNKLGNLARTAIGIGSQWIPDHKKTSSHLISQIHFCRFFYKLIQRMQNSCFGSQKLKSLMANIIAGKFNEIKELKVVNQRYATIYRRTKEYQKVQEIIDQYMIKYEKVIQRDQANAYEDALGSIQSQLINQILILYGCIIKHKTLQGHQQQIILLDYLITLKQLLAINSNKDIQYFHNKSKIEAIVDGRPSKNITQQHLQAIVNKLKLFKMII